jgi:hypothetical protein
MWWPQLVPPKTERWIDLKLRQIEVQIPRGASAVTLSRCPADFPAARPATGKTPIVGRFAKYPSRYAQTRWAGLRDGGQSWAADARFQASRSAAMAAVQSARRLRRIERSAAKYARRAPSARMSQLQRQGRNRCLCVPAQRRRLAAISTSCAGGKPSYGCVRGAPSL